MGATSRLIAAALLTLCCVGGVVAFPTSAAAASPGSFLAGTDEFLWGVATSGFQSEGSSPDSNWSRYSASGRTHDQIGNSVDFRHRYSEDIDRAADLGAEVFRFGVEWARVQPTPGTWNENEFAYYDSVVAYILERGMKPMITLDHWVYPGWVVDQGGWMNPKTEVDWLANAEKVVARYSGMNALWITINEPTVYVQRELTYGAIALPQAPTMFDALVRVHRTIYDRIHALDPGTGVSSNFSFIPAVSEAIDSVFTDRIRDKLDFLGIDYYYGVALDNPTAAYAAIDEFYNVTPQPEGLYDALMRYSWKYPELPLYIVENGMPTDNGNPRSDGYTRSNHLSDHIYWMERAREDGAHVIGYNYWSITDNYEWGSYRPRFGLYTVDVIADPTLTRTPTDAVDTYRRIIGNGGVGADYVPVKAPAFCSLVDPPLSCTNPQR